jgi:hypothetical protein
MDRIEKLGNDVCSFNELDSLEKHATKFGDAETLDPSMLRYPGFKRNVFASA